MTGSFFMANYINQGYIEKLNAKVATSNSPRLRASDLRASLYGGRGTRFNELIYLRNQNTDSQTVNTNLPDAWTKFGPANGAAGTRPDQIFHDFQINGTYP